MYSFWLLVSFLLTGHASFACCWTSGRFMWSIVWGQLGQRAPPVGLAVGGVLAPPRLLGCPLALLFTACCLVRSLYRPWLFHCYRGACVSSWHCLAFSSIWLYIAIDIICHLFSDLLDSCIQGCPVDHCHLCPWLWQGGGGVVVPLLEDSSKSRWVIS